MSTLRINVRHADGTAIIELEGELDLGGVDEFDGELERAMAPGPERLVLDLSRLDFMDSSGLRSVVVAESRALADNLGFALVRGPESVHRVFEMTRMAERFEFVEEF